jgi:hypothetical protein
MVGSKTSVRGRGAEHKPTGMYSQRLVETCLANLVLRVKIKNTKVSKRKALRGHSPDNGSLASYSLRLRWADT